MLLSRLKEDSLRQSLRDRVDSLRRSPLLNQMPVGVWDSPEAMIEYITFGNHDPALGTTVVGRGVLELMRSSHFDFGEKKDVLPIVVKPRDLGITDRVYPAEVRKRALDWGLAVCPDDLVAEYERRVKFSYTLLFAIRDIVPGPEKGVMFRISTFDRSQRAIGCWEGSKRVGPDTKICFVA